MSVDLHISITVSVQGRKHDAERACPVAEEHEQTVTKALLRKDTSPLVHCGGHGRRELHSRFFHFKVHFNLFVIQ